MPWHASSLNHGDVLAFAAAAPDCFVSIHHHENSGVYHSADNGATWVPILEGLPDDTWITSLVRRPGHLFAGTVGHSLYCFYDHEGRWAPCCEALPAHETVLALALHNGGLYAGTETAGVYRSEDGTTWQPANAGLPLDGQGLAVATLATLQGTLFASHVFGLHRSVDEGATWQPVPTGPSMQALPSLYATPGGVLFACGANGLFRSLNGGTRWSRVAHPAWDGALLRTMAGDGTTLFVGTQGTADSDVYASADGGATWHTVSLGLPRPAWSMMLAVAGDHLLAGPGGHGVWRRPVAECRIAHPADRSGAAFVLDQNSPNPFDETTTISYTLLNDEHVSLTVSDIFGQEVATLIDEARPAGQYEEVFAGDELPGGLYVYRLRAGGITQSRQMVLLK